MAEGILTNVASKILEMTGRSVVKEAASWWGAADDLKKLERSLGMIRAWIADAEKRFGAEQSATTKEKLRRLRDVLLRADDLFDDVLYFDRRKQEIKGNKLTKEVQIFFSSLGPFSYNRKIAHEIKSIRKELDNIKSDIAGLESFVMPAEETSLWMSKLLKNRETMSFVQPNNVIGRDDDKNNIIDILVDPIYGEKKLTVLPIVGFGGIGKTTIAQLVFNDDGIKAHFTCMKWVCVPVINDMKEVLRIIYMSFTGTDPMNRSSEDLQNGIRESVVGRKFLLILDDIWEESRERWLPLLSLLGCGEKGSMIIVTTRSGVVASVIGTISAYNLGLLTQEESWKLFKGLAFRPGQEESNPNFTKIGKHIIEKCGNVPLAIRTIGSLLYSKDSEQEWVLIKDSNLFESELLDGSGIMPVLQLSYDFLSSPLKKCFAYCSLFKKDYEFDRAELVRLWMAQGYIETLDENLNLEDVGDLYFQELLRRNFFQIDQQNDTTIIGYKIHDIMHDMACRVAADTLECGFSSSWVAVSKVRTLLDHHHTSPTSPDHHHTTLTYKMLPKLHSLRVLRGGDAILNVSWPCGYYTLRGLVKRLRHLRYLSVHLLYRLPDFISKLDNLQTLQLQCIEVTELPRGFTKLTNLRHLGIKSCPLSDLPPGFKNMKSLRDLDKFVVGKSNGLDALAGMNLRGNLLIEIRSFRENGVSEAKKSNLKDKHQLVELKLNVYNCSGSVVLARGFLMFIPNLVSVTVNDCKTCQQLPGFNQLPLLKYLRLESLGVLEYIEDDISVADTDSSCSAAYFPSLVELVLSQMPELKEWSKMEVPLFPCLSEIFIKNCPKLASMPTMPRLEKVWVSSIGEKLLRSIVKTGQNLPTKSKAWYIEHIDSLSSWSIDIPPTLESLNISYCKQLTSFKVEEQNCFVRELRMSGCCALRNIWNGVQQLSVLEELYIHDCEELDMWDMNYKPPAATNILRRLEVTLISKLETIPSGICGFFTELQYLLIYALYNLKALPEQIGQLSQLRSLTVWECPKLESLPQSFANLISMKDLEFRDCSPLLITRCRRPDGEYWPLIQHIPRFWG